MNKYIFVFLFTIATQAQTFNFSCAPPPEENLFPQDQIDRLINNGFKKLVENNVAYYEKSFYNNAATRYVIKSRTNESFATWYYDSRYEGSYANDADNDLNLANLIGRMLSAPLSDDSWITSDQRDRLTNAGFRWNASIDPLLGSRFNFTGHHTGLISVSSIGSLLRFESRNSEATVNTSSAALDNFIDRAIALTLEEQSAYAAAVDSFSSEFDDLGSDFEATPQNSYSFFNIRRIDDGELMGVISVEEGDIIKYSFNGNTYDTIGLAFYQAGIAWSIAQQTVIIFDLGAKKWRGQNASLGSQDFDHSSVATDYVANGLIGVLGFTGAEKADLLATGWEFVDNKFTKRVNNSQRIFYAGNNIWQIDVKIGNSNNWGTWGRDFVSAQAAVDFANDHL